MDMLTLVAAASWFVGAFVNGLTGMGGALISLPIISMFSPSKEVIVISTIAGMQVATMAFILYFRHIRLRESIGFWIASLPGIPCGVMVLRFVDIEMLQLLSQEFGVSIHELLSGEYLSDEEFRKKADEIVVAVSKESAFSVQERKAFFRKKWRREHISLLVLLGLLLLASAILPFALGKPRLLGFVPLLALLAYGYQNNKMMSYVEHSLYD